MKITMMVARAFIYAFLFFLGTCAVLDMPYFLGEIERPVFGYLFALKISLVGGASGALAGIALKLLVRLGREVLDA